jgi:elongin-A
MPADSLLDMARRAMARYSNAINDIGDMPYALVRPALLKVDHPDRLVSFPPHVPILRQLILLSDN